MTCTVFSKYVKREIVTIVDEEKVNTILPYRLKCACMYVCMHVCTCVYVCVYACHVCAYMCACMVLCMCVRACVVRSVFSLCSV